MEFSTRRRGYPASLPEWAAVEIRQMYAAAGRPVPNIVGRHSSQMTGRSRKYAEEQEAIQRTETVQQRVRRVASALKAARKQGF